MVFITFEGGDGAGKSTQVRLLAAALEQRGFEVVVTREPGGTPIAERIRDVVLSLENTGLDKHAEALLYAASRAEHVAKMVRPALASGKVVISDRYMDSSIAYQGIGRGLGVKQVRDLNLWATDGLLPDLTVLLDVAPAHGLGRVAEPNRLEAEPEEFHLDVREAFLDLAAAEPERFLILPARDSIESIAERILTATLTRLGSQ